MTTDPIKITSRYGLSPGIQTGPHPQGGKGPLAELGVSQQRAHFTADILCVVMLAAPADAVPASIKVSAVAAAAAAMRFMAEFLHLGDGVVPLRAC